MLSVRAPRLVVAGTASGSGKTVVACGLMRALARRGLRVQAAKCGPDYLDPMFHARVLGAPSRNLDLFLGGEALARALVAQGARDSDLTLVEGVMGYYDGIAGGQDSSTYDLARVLDAPALLVVDGRGRSLSAAAEVLGFDRLRRPSRLSAVVLNRVSAGAYGQLKAAVERETGLPVVGRVPVMGEARLKSRHLGLVRASEVADLRERMDALAEAMERTVDVDAVVRLASSAAPLELESPLPAPGCSCAPGTEVREAGPIVAVARDEAFCFAYADSLALLERLGARLAFFSPLADAHLPEGASGLVLGGGYPELHARELSANAPLLAELRHAIAAGLPTIAECGGFLYLHRTLEDETGVPWPMVGALDGHARRGTRLGNFGYATMVARRDGLLAREGESLRVHEFHYWQSDCAQDAFRAQKPQGTRGWDCVVGTPTLHAGFPHLYLPGSPTAAGRFVEACRRARARGAAVGAGACGDAWEGGAP